MNNDDLRKEYEADLAVNPNCIEAGWWEYLHERIRGVNDEIIREVWLKIPPHVSIFPSIATVRRSPSAPNRDEWVYEKVKASAFVGVGLDGRVYEPEDPPDKCANCTQNGFMHSVGCSSIDCKHYDETVPSNCACDNITISDGVCVFYSNKEG